MIFANNRKGIQLLNSADILWGTRDEPLRTSMWEAKSKVVLSHVAMSVILLFLLYTPLLLEGSFSVILL